MTHAQEQTQPHTQSLSISTVAERRSITPLTASFTLSDYNNMSMLFQPPAPLLSP